MKFLFWGDKLTEQMMLRGQGMKIMSWLEIKRLVVCDEIVCC